MPRGNAVVCGVCLGHVVFPSIEHMLCLRTLAGTATRVMQLFENHLQGKWCISSDIFRGNRTMMRTITVCYDNDKWFKLATHAPPYWVHWPLFLYNLLFLLPSVTELLCFIVLGCRNQEPVAISANFFLLEQWDGDGSRESWKAADRLDWLSDSERDIFPFKGLSDDISRRISAFIGSRLFSATAFLPVKVLKFAPIFAYVACNCMVYGF